jgi:hypothetical protein
MPPCPSPTCPAAGDYTFQNVSTNGIGTFSSVANGLVGFRSVEGDGINTVCTLDVPNNAIKVALTAAAAPPAVFANAAARAAAVPAFVGQIGVEQDTLTAYMSYGTSAGNWQNQFLTNGVAQVLSESDAGTTFQVPNEAIFEIIDTTSGGSIFQLVGGVGWNMQGTWNYSSNCTITFGGGVITNFASGSILNYVAGALVKLAGTSIPANSVMTIGGTAGEPNYSPISNFLSTGNLSSAYTLNATATLRAFDATTIGGSYSQTVLTNLANTLLTLITDLAARLLPQT